MHAPLTFTVSRDAVAVHKQREAHEGGHPKGNIESSWTIENEWIWPPVRPKALETASRHPNPIIRVSWVDHNETPPNCEHRTTSP